MATATQEKTTGAAAEVKPINQEIINGAEIGKKGIELDGKTGVATGKTKELYAQLLAHADEEVTLDMVERVHRANDKVLSMMGLAVGETANAAMKKNPELGRVTFSMPMTGRDTMDFVYDRSRTVPDRQADGTMGTKTKYGNLSVEINHYGSRNRGQLAAVKAKLSADASKLLG